MPLSSSRPLLLGAVALVAACATATEAEPDASVLPCGAHGLACCAASGSRPPCVDPLLCSATSTCELPPELADAGTDDAPAPAPDAPAPAPDASLPAPDAPAPDAPLPALDAPRPMTDAPAPSLDAPSPVRDVTTADRPVAPDRVAPPPMCPSPRVPCGAVCVDLASDLSNCGSCGTVCPPGSPCESRVCGMPRPLVVVMVSEGLATMPDGPMRTGPLLSLRITFSLPVTGVTTGAFRLYLSGRSVSLRDMRISGSGAVWQLTLPSSLTNIRARYRIDIGGPMSTIRAGTLAMTAIHSVYWVRV